jgi:hypothetical protein
MDSPTPAAKSLVPIALAFALVTGASPARAQEPSDNGDSLTPSTPAPAASDDSAAAPGPAAAPKEAAPAPKAAPIEEAGSYFTSGNPLREEVSPLLVGGSS